MLSAKFDERFLPGRPSEDDGWTEGHDAMVQAYFAHRILVILLLHCYLVTCSPPTSVEHFESQHSLRTISGWHLVRGSFVLVDPPTPFLARE